MTAERERGWLSYFLQHSLQINFETGAVVEVVLLLAFFSSLIHPCELRIILQNNKKKKMLILAITLLLHVATEMVVLAQ